MFSFVHLFNVENNKTLRQEKLAEVEEDGSINYTKFLERYRVQVSESTTA